MTLPLKRRKVSSLINWGLLLFLLTFIWGNSLLPGETSGAVSGWVGKVLQFLLPFLPLDQPEGAHILRKIAHFSEFALLGFTLCWRFGMHCRRHSRWLLLTVGCGILTACIDENLQRFSPGRHCSIVDVGIDSAGVLTGTLFLLLLLTLFRRRTK